MRRNGNVLGGLIRRGHALFLPFGCDSGARPLLSWTSRQPLQVPTMKPSPILSAFTILTLASLPVAQSRPVFLTPTQMPAPVNMAGSSSYSMTLSADGLQAMVETDRPGGHGGHDIFLLQRASTQSAFTSNGPMGFCGPYDEGGGVWSDPVTVLFHSNRPGGAGGCDNFAFTFTQCSLIAPLNSVYDDTQPSISGDGLEIFFTSNRPGSLGGKSIWRSTRASVNDAWGSPICLSGIDSANHEQSPSLTDDGLFLFFASNRSGNFDIYAASRATRQSPFGAPARVPELSGPNQDVGIALWNIGASGQDGIAQVTVMVNGRAVIMSAARDGSTPMACGSSLSASDSVAPDEVLSVRLRAPVGDYGIVFLGAPMAPMQLGFGELRVDPAVLLVLDAGVQVDEVRLLQTLLPDDQRLHGMPIALQALVGKAPQLRLTDAVLTTVR